MVRISLNGLPYYLNHTLVGLCYYYLICWATMKVKNMLPINSAKVIFCVLVIIADNILYMI